MISLTCETRFWIIEHMFKKIDNKGQSSAEIILITGGLLVIVLFVASYITNIINTTQNSYEALIKQERDFLINKI